jgi:hypothetical protein
MTKKEIKQAIDEGRVVAIEGEHLSRVCYDLFGNIVVASLCAEYPIRKLTDEDVGRAILLNE